MDGYELLGNAIVVQAIEDYLSNKEKLYKLETRIYKIKGRRVLSEKRTKHMNICNREIHDCVRFFRSEWYKELSTIEGETLIKMLDREFKERKPKIILKAVS